MDILQKDIDITHLSNYKTKATTKYYFEINNIEDVYELVDIIKFAKENDLKTLFVWWWTNILFAFNNYKWVVIKNNLNWWSYDGRSWLLESYSSNSITDIATIIERDDGQGLWHRFIWLPWTIWWAVFWNAWCFGLEIENNFIDAIVYNLKEGHLERLSKVDMNFSYRSSILKEKSKYFLVSAKFDLSKKIEKYSSDVDNIKFREESQPKWNTCWSFFKNPSKEQSAWLLIEQSGFKWYNLWWASFSNIHANFLMNEDGWNYKDLLKLIKLVKKTVKEKFWIKLINEIRIIKN